MYALIGLGKKYGRDRVEQACAVALAAGMHDVKRLQRMLELAVTTSPAQHGPKPLPRSRFLRPARELNR